MFGSEDEGMITEFKTQAKRCDEMCKARVDDLAEKVGELRMSVMVENASALGRKWLNTIPLFQPLRIPDATISTGLRYRTLAKSYRPTCRCGKDAELMHEETCPQTNHTHRHNEIRDHIAAALSKCVPTEVIVEPHSDEGARRNDIGLRGPGRSGRRALDYDLKVFSMNRAEASESLHRPNKKDNKMQEMKERCDKWLASVEKRTVKKAPQTRVAEFRPLVISTGGLMASDTAKEFETWKKELGGIGYARMMEVISISLVKWRARKLKRLLLHDGRGDEGDDI